MNRKNLKSTNYLLTLFKILVSFFVEHYLIIYLGRKNPASSVIGYEKSFDYYRSRIWVRIRNLGTSLTKYPPFSELFTHWPFHYKNRNVNAFRESLLDLAISLRSDFLVHDFNEDEHFIYLVIVQKWPKRNEEKNKVFLEKVREKFGSTNLYVESFEEDERIKVVKIRRDAFLDT